MSKRSERRYKRKNNAPLLAIVIGLGLIAVGLLFLWPGGQGGAAASSGGRESSVVPVKVNFAAPELSLVNLQGESESLARYRGKVLLVNNWATWCPPCKAEMPTLEAYYEAHAPEGFAIVAIEAGDAKDGVLQFAQGYGLQFSVWLDPDSASLRAFGNGNLPNSYVIDRSGTVRYAWTGEISRAMLEKFITPLLQE